MALRALRCDWRTALSALLIVLAFPPFDLRWLIWFSLVPWFTALHRSSGTRQAMIQGLWLSILMSLGGFAWVAYVLQQFANLPWAVAILGLLLYSLIGQPQFYLFAGIQRRLLQRFDAERLNPGLAIALAGTLGALAYSSLDWLLPKLFVDTLGHSLYRASWLRQAADLGGTALLTTAIWMVNESIWGLLHSMRSRGEPSAWPALSRSVPLALLSAALVAALAGYGARRDGEVQAAIARAPKKIQFGVIQANIGDIDKLAAETGVRGASEKVLSIYYEMTEKALSLSPKPQVIVWPETSFPSTFRSPSNASELARDQALEAFVRKKGVPLLFGGYDTDGRKDYNAFFFLRPDGDTGLSGRGDLQVYRKNILLPFGEYIPGAAQIKFVRDAFPQVGYFGTGNGPELKRVLDFDVGPIICYEALFPDFILESARKGSRLILNITNDSWFGPWGEPQLHLALTTFRSIESRLPQLRSTNTGISALILPDGSMESATHVFQPEILNVSVPLIDPIPTLMLAWGNWFPRMGLGIGFGGIIALAWMDRKRRLSRV